MRTVQTHEITGEEGQNKPDLFLMGAHTTPGFPSQTLTYGDW